MSDKEYVTTRELAAEIRAVRWEQRAIAAVQTLALLGVLGYRLSIPPVTEAVRLVSNIF